MNLLTLNSTNATALYYRSLQSGYWKVASVWETADDVNFTVNVVTASIAPDFNSATILIRNGHTITIDQSLILDETIVEFNGTLIYGNYVTSVLSINNGAGVDLQVDGTLEDSGPFNIGWTSSSASWALGSTGTIIRTRSTSATFWRDHYEGGMSMISPSSTWIIRKQGADNPSISAIASFYGNLKIENTTAAFWNATVVGSKFIGTSSAPVIKGNMEVGTSSGFGVKFYSQNSAVAPLLIKGNLLINSGSEFNLEDASTTTGASGVEIQGNLLVNGTLSYDLTDAADNNRTIKFSGLLNQTLSGTGNLYVYNLVNNKISGDLILNRAIDINNKLTLENGKLELNKNTLTLQNNSPLALARINGWIKSEAVDNTSKLAWNIGALNGVYEFPFGKDAAHYIPFFFTLTTGNAGLVSISTYGTSSDNLPFPSLPVLVTNLDINGVNDSSFTVDRYWQIDKTGSLCTATFSFSYSNTESPTTTSILFAQQYNSSTNTWDPALCCQTQDLTNHTVTIPNVQNFGVWSLMENNLALKFDETKNNSNVLTETTAILIFPNPCNEMLYLHYYAEESAQLEIGIYNSIGIKLEDKKMECKKGENSFGLDLSNIDDGLIYLKIADREKVIWRKVLKERN